MNVNHTNGPGWYADPSGGHQLRYFDGQWTEHVSDAGVIASAPIALAETAPPQRMAQHYVRPDSHSDGAVQFLAQQTDTHRSVPSARSRAPFWWIGAAVLGIAVILIVVIATSSDSGKSLSSGGGSGGGSSDGGGSSGRGGSPPIKLHGSFCADVWNVTYSVASLDHKAVEASVGGGQTPSSSDWKNADSAVYGLQAEAPSTVVAGAADSTAKGIVSALVYDVDEIVRSGYDDSNGGADLEGDNGQVQQAALALNCPQPAN